MIQLYVIFLIQTKGVPHKVCNLYPRIYQHHLHNLQMQRMKHNPTHPSAIPTVKQGKAKLFCLSNLKPRNSKEDDGRTVLKGEVQGKKSIYIYLT